jgi:predicted permease
VFSVPVNVVVSGSLSGLNKFVYQLQSNQPRAVLITQLTEGSGLNGSTGNAAASSQSTLTMAMQVFVAPGSAATPQVTPTASTAP